MRLRFASSVLAIAAVIGLASGAQAAVSSYLSTVGTVGGGFTASNLNLNFDASGNANGSIYLWLKNDAKLQSVAYNLASSDPTKLKFTGVTVYTPDILIGGTTDIGDRWNLPVSAGTLAPNGATVTNFSAVNVDKAGLDPATRSFDALYDTVAAAALFAKIDFMALANGPTNLTLTEGSTLIVENSVQPPLTFGTGLITVSGLGAVVNPLITVSGNGNLISNGDLSPSTTDNTSYGSVALNSVQNRQFTINNPGTADLTVGSPTITGPFSVVGAFPTTIAAAGNANFTLQLNTSTLGAKTGSISFSTNVTGSNPFGFNLAGTVIPEPASLSLCGLAVFGLFGLVRRRS